MNRCPLCPGVNACIPPDGAPNAEVLFIGEAPGFQENRKGKVFIGPTGEEVNRHYLPLAGLTRPGVRITNAIRCYPVSAGGKLDPNRAKDLALLHSCASTHLYPTIEQTRPRLLVPLGAFACRAVTPQVDLDLQHGFPVMTDWGIPAFPMYHPALGMHEPKKMLHIRTDWQRLRQYLKGKLELPVDLYPTPDYREVTDEDEIQDIDPDHPIAFDTESEKGRHPYCLTWSCHAGSGRLIRASNVHLIQSLGKRLRDGRGPYLFHNWLYDWPVTQAMGLQLRPDRVVDTMARAYQLGNLPQGLKALAFRELGMEMQDFDDLVTPHSRLNVLTYYTIAASYTWPKPDADVVQDSKTGVWKPYQPQSMSTKLKRFFTDLSKNPEKDVFEMWDNWADSHEMIEAACGPWPGKCITHAPFEQVLYYACRDADATLRLWPLLQRMSRRVRKAPQERWRDAA